MTPKRSDDRDDAGSKKKKVAWFWSGTSGQIDCFIPIFTVRIVENNVAVRIHKNQAV